jgi:hypothetical protein
MLQTINKTKKQLQEKSVLNFEVFESDDVELAQADSRAEPSQEPS